MKCPRCDGQVYCTDSRPKERPHEWVTRRRHRCKECDHRFFTIEHVEDGREEAAEKNRQQLAQMEKDLKHYRGLSIRSGEAEEYY